MTLVTAMVWAIFYLSQHPEIQDKVRAEVQQVLGNRTDVDREDYANLRCVFCCHGRSLLISTYLGKVFKEQQCKQSEFIFYE